MTAGIIETSTIDTDAVSSLFWCSCVLTNVTLGASVIARQVDTDGANMWALYTMPSALKLTWATSAGSTTWTAAATIERDKNHHIAFHIDNTGPTPRLWIDGT